MARMFRLPQGGYIVDTPGIRDLTIWELTRAELPGYFHEFDDWAQGCRYQPCSHIHEPECAVRKAVQEGKLDRQRYENYCRLWMSLPEHVYQWRGRVR
jgi:ribosome biogenesis GTPase